jgi:hypothetical protein
MKHRPNSLIFVTTQRQQGKIPQPLWAKKQGDGNSVASAAKPIEAYRPNSWPLHPDTVAKFPAYVTKTIRQKNEQL